MVLYLCAPMSDLVNFFNMRGRPGPPAICRASNNPDAMRSSNAHPAVATWREKMACTVLEVLVTVIVGGDIAMQSKNLHFNDSTDFAHIYP